MQLKNNYPVWETKLPAFTEDDEWENDIDDDGAKFGFSEV